MSDQKVEVPGQFVQEMTAYINNVTPVLDKQAAFESSLAGKAESAVNALIAADMLAAHQKQAKLDEIKANPLVLCDIITKVAAMSKTASIGSTADAFPSASATLTADEQFNANVMRMA